jgi:cystathionine beta-lyase
MARARGLVTMIDNAWASPMFSRPFDWGVDMSILPLTKYWSGHADVLMGAVVVREALWPALHTSVRQLGICVGGDDAFLILRGLRTANVRMLRHQQSGSMSRAGWHARPEVAAVLHPALPSHPQHALWKRDFQGSSGLFSFELRSRDLPIGPTRCIARKLAALCQGRRFFRIGYSWGGYESLIVPARLTGLRTVHPWRAARWCAAHRTRRPSRPDRDLEAGLAAMHAAH